MSTLSMSAMARLVDAAASIVAEAELPDVLRRVAETAKSLTGARYAALGVVGEYGLLTEFIHVGMDRHTAEMIGNYPTGKGVLGLLIHQGETIRLDEISSHPDSVGFPAHHPPMGTFLGVPVRVGDVVFGNIYLTEKPEGFTDEDESTVEALAVIAGAAVGTSRLRERLEALALADERERIARDVHDSIIQDLFAVGLSLQMISTRTGHPGLTDDLDRVADQVDRSITSLRSLILDLRSESSPTSLENRLRSAIDELTQPDGTRVILEVTDQGTIRHRKLYDDLVAIAKEATSNALRHAGANTITVRVEEVGDALIVEVIDNGSGFDPEETPRGMGLYNIQSRAAELEGSLKISSAAGQGTVLSVAVPIPVR